MSSMVGWKNESGHELQSLKNLLEFFININYFIKKFIDSV